MSLLRNLSHETSFFPAHHLKKRFYDSRPVTPSQLQQLSRCSTTLFLQHHQVLDGTVSAVLDHHTAGSENYLTGIHLPPTNQLTNSSRHNYHLRTRSPVARFRESLQDIKNSKKVSGTDPDSPPPHIPHHILIPIASMALFGTPFSRQSNATAIQPAAADNTMDKEPLLPFVHCLARHVCPLDSRLVEQRVRLGPGRWHRVVSAGVPACD